MNILIIFAHPEPKSFNGYLKDYVANHFNYLGHSVEISDLFESNFKASADKSDFDFYNEDLFDLQIAQKQAQFSNQVADDIKLEQEKLLRADLIIFQFPLWWYSVPAPLKGYIDRVFTVGFAYGGNSLLSGKKVLISTTTGAPKQFWTEDQKGTIEQVLFPLTYGTFKMLGLDVIESFVIYGTKRIPISERENHAKILVSKIEDIIS